LEEKGIGRPSTYAPSLQPFGPGLCGEGRQDIGSDRARQNRYGYYEKLFQDIVDVEFTAQMEKTLDEVEEGEKRWVDVMKALLPIC